MPENKHPNRRVFVPKPPDSYHREEISHKILIKVQESELERTLNQMEKEGFSVQEINETGKNPNGAPLYRVHGHKYTEMVLAEMDTEGKVVRMGYELQQYDDEKAAEAAKAKNKEGSRANEAAGV